MQLKNHMKCYFDCVASALYEVKITLLKYYPNFLFRSELVLYLLLKPEAHKTYGLLTYAEVQSYSTQKNTTVYIYDPS